MRMDCRVKYDVEVRRKAVELFASGMGFCAVAITNIQKEYNLLETIFNGLGDRSFQIDGQV